MTFRAKRRGWESAQTPKRASDSALDVHFQQGTPQLVTCHKRIREKASLRHTHKGCGSCRCPLLSRERRPLGRNRT